MNEVLVLGGGLAGGASAALLAKAGMSVQLVERESGPHNKVCGEFLSIEAQRDLETIGLDLKHLGAVPIDRVRLVSGDRNAEAKLPFVALGISREILDEALLSLASSNGARIHRGVRVTGLDECGVRTTHGPIAARQILLATGKHDIRGARRTESTPRDGYVGYKMHFRPSPGQRRELAGFIDLVLFNGGYAGLQLVGEDVMNLCLVLRQTRLKELGSRWDDVFAMLMDEAHMARRLGDAETLFPRPLTIANLPYGYVCDPSSSQPQGIMRLGDQAAMTASLTGDGMALALRSAHLAADCLKAGLDAPAFHQALRKGVMRQVRRAMLLQHATEFPLAVQAGCRLMRLWPGLLGYIAAATRLPYSRSA